MTLEGNQPPPSGRLIARKLPPPEVREIIAADGGTLSASEIPVRRRVGSRDESIRVADGDRLSGVDTVGSRVLYTLTGPPPQNEDGSLQVAQSVVEAISLATGADWSPPVQPESESGVDAIAASPDGGELHIQVTRTSGDSSVWRDLGRSARADRSGSVDELADALWDSIAKKSDLASRQSICLALDARVAIEQAIPLVVERFRERYLGQLLNLGFQQVWLVGPSPDLVFRLDS